jgi:ADP-ribose pyrophosphatase YjhB (NUDIX family)
MNFCSNCGARVALHVPQGDDRQRYMCATCGRIHYDNPKLVVGCIPQWEDKILLCRRGIEPKKGMWTLPAGYLENGETVMEGASRETLEEAGVTVTELQPYLLFDIIHVHQLYLMFRGRMQTPEFKVTPESSEVVLMRREEIPWDAIAFRAIESTLRHYFADRDSGRFPFRIRQIVKDPSW